MSKIVSIFFKANIISWQITFVNFSTFNFWMFFLIILQERGLISIKVEKQPPLDKASNPIAPLPANKSKKYPAKMPL